MDPFAALRLAIDGLKGAAETLNKAQIEAAVAEIRTALLAAQEVALGLQMDATEYYKTKAALEKRIVELTHEVEKLEEWRTKAACYTLTTAQPNSLTWVREFNPKKGEENGIAEPLHWACPSCFEKRQRSILYQESAGIRFAKCPTCEFKVEIRPPAPRQPPPGHSGIPFAYDF